MKTISLILLTACGAAEPTCRTTCGMAFTGPWSCADVQRFEERVLIEASKLDLTPDVCGALAHAEVVVMETSTFVADGRLVSGNTVCEGPNASTLQLGAGPSPFNSSFAHELVHHLDRCLRVPGARAVDEFFSPDDSSAQAHWHWKQRGVMDFLNRMETP